MLVLVTAETTTFLVYQARWVLKLSTRSCPSLLRQLTQRRLSGPSLASDIKKTWGFPFKTWKMFTVNQLNFAAIKFCGLPKFSTLDIFRAIKFRVLVSQDLFLAKTLFHKNACNSLNNGPILKIQIVPES